MASSAALMLNAAAIMLFAMLCPSCTNAVNAPTPARTITVPEPPSPISSNALCHTTHAPTPEHVEGEPSKPPKRDPAGVQAIVRTSYRDLRLCYQAALERKHDASGRVQVRFVIDESGRVASACVEPPVLPDGVAINCMLARIKRIEFGEGARVIMVYPIQFAPGTNRSEKTAAH